MGHMSKKRMSFPMEVQTGSVIVKIYRVRNKAYRVTAWDNSTEERDRFSFMVSFFADGKRRQKMFADFGQAHAEAASTAGKLAAGQLDAVEMSNKESSIFAHATEAVKPAGGPLELAAKEYAEARERILKHVFCGKCRGSVGMVRFTGEEENGDVILKGSCAVCGQEVVRVVEISERDLSGN